MPLLIRGGLLMSMTDQESHVADILISRGRILQVEEHIDVASDCAMTVLEADGVTVTPGLVNAWMEPCGSKLSDVSANALTGGVTGGLIASEAGETCALLCGGAIRQSRFCLLEAAHTDPGSLRRSAARCRSDSRIPVFRIQSEDECRMALEAAAGAPCILLALNGCTDLRAVISVSDASVIIGDEMNAGNPWRMIKDLTDAGVRVALSCRYPRTKIHLLPILAGLCHREGMTKNKALSCITRNPAEMLNMSRRGQIAPGYHADLVLYDGDPTMLASSIATVIVGGCIVHGA